MPDSIKILIYRVFQEALNNAAKHSKARNVVVVLNHIEENIVLTIEDDGIGFDAREIVENPKVYKNFGLDSMKERAELFGGKFSLQTQVGHGTKIQGSWPVSTS